MIRMEAFSRNIAIATGIVIALLFAAGLARGMEPAGLLTISIGLASGLLLVGEVGKLWARHRRRAGLAGPEGRDRLMAPITCAGPEHPGWRAGCSGGDRSIFVALLQHFPIAAVLDCLCDLLFLTLQIRSLPECLRQMLTIFENGSYQGYVVFFE